nr:hypothetical protein B0A51_00800 [Rachicladosporium sp. CCFEE 5018]
MASRARPLVESDDWKERFNALFNRATTQTAEPVETVAEPVETVAEPVKTVAEPVKTVAEPVETAAEPVSEPVTTTATTVSEDAATRELDEWKAGWWSVSSSASVAKGRERLAAVKAAEPGVERAKERDALKAEHERIYQFFQKRYGGDNTSLPAWQKLCVDAEVEVGSRIRECKDNLNKIYVYIYQFVHAVETGGKVDKLATFEDLEVLVKIKAFPLKKALANEFLEVMLKHIWSGDINRTTEQSMGPTAGTGGLRPQRRGPTGQARRTNDVSSVNARIAAIRARKAAAKDGSNGNRE